MKKLIIMFLSMLLIVGCSKSTPDVYYEDFPEILDFGKIADIEPEVIVIDEDESTTYKYTLTDDVNEKIFDRFFASFKKNKYEKGMEDTVTDNGLLLKMHQNPKFQVMTSEIFDSAGKNKKHVDTFLVSIRNRFFNYDKYPTVPDFGKFYNVEPDIVTEGEGATAYTFYGLTDRKNYIEAIKNLGFEIIEEGLSYPHETGSGTGTVYADDEHYVLIWEFPLFTLINAGIN